MVRQNIAEIEEYQDKGFVLKKLYKGAQSEAVLMHLKPGQEVPTHPHDRFEVVLIPQKGRALLKVDGQEPFLLLPGIIHYEGAGQRFGIVNNGDCNFQTIVVLVHIADPD